MNSRYLMPTILAVIALCVLLLMLTGCEPGTTVVPSPDYGPSQVVESTPTPWTDGYPGGTTRTGPDGR